MDILGWLWWTISSALGVILSLVWFLLGGWVSTLAQLIVILFAVFAMKYGWRQAPFELWSRASSFGRFAWGWIRAKDPSQAPARVEVREVVRTVRVKERGDINVSTLLSFLMLAGIALVGAL